jgi:hypothetical protein
MGRTGLSGRGDLWRYGYQRCYPACHWVPSCFVFFAFLFFLDLGITADFILSLLCRPNEAVDCLVTRFKTDELGHRILRDSKPILEFIAVERSPNIWAIPGNDITFIDVCVPRV